MIQHTQFNKCKCNIAHKQNKGQTHFIIYIDAEKSFDTIQHSLMIKNLNKLGIERTYLNMIKAI
jgi:hypothetical protein